MLSRSAFLCIHRQLQILSKPDCCLCDKAHWAVSRLVDNLKFTHPNTQVTVHTINIAQNHPELLAEYELTIPVILVDGRLVCESLIDITLVRNALVNNYTQTHVHTSRPLCIKFITRHVHIHHAHCTQLILINTCTCTYIKRIVNQFSSQERQLRANFTPVIPTHTQVYSYTQTNCHFI